MTLSAPAAAPAAIPAQPQRKPIAKLVIATSVGNALEWYDIAVYGYFAVYISKAFFPNSDPTISLLLTLGTFALSFLTRPLGGVILGIYADRHGRKASLMISILLMTLGTLVITFMPAYATIGVAAPIAVLIARLVQGFSAGGEFGSSTAFLVEHMPERRDVYRSISEEMTAANRGAVSPRGFELSARRIGRLMREQFNLGFVDVGGWDTHVNQGAATGYLADRLGELGRALAGFSEEIGPAGWRDTVVVVISEFGRTFRENGDHGTDHGHGSVYWVMGGGINGGRIIGEQMKVDQPHLFQNRDYPVLTDYRAMFAGLFQHMFGLQDASLQRIFAGTHPAELGLV